MTGVLIGLATRGTKATKGVITTVACMAFFLAFVPQSFATSPQEPEQQSAPSDCLSTPKTPAGFPCGPRGKNFIIGDTLYIEGRIDSMLYNLMKMEGLETIIKKVELNSYGGQYNTELPFTSMVAEIIRTRKMTTSVREQARCASSCTLLFQAGEKRIAHKTALFGYHPAQNRSSETDYLTGCLGEGPRRRKRGSPEVCRELFEKWRNICQAGTEQIFKELETYGASLDLFKDFKNQPEDPDWLENSNPLKLSDMVLGAQDALRYNVATEIAD